MTGLPVLLRLGWREARRHWVRTTLVGLLIGVPVMVLSGGLVLARSVDPGGSTATRGMFGSASGTIDTGLAGLSAATADFDETVAFRTAPVYRAVGKGGRLHEITVISGSFDDPLVRGAFVAIDGRLAERAGEAVITPDLARRFKARLGDRLRIDVPKLEVEVVGLGGSGWTRNSEEMLLGSGTLPDDYAGPALLTGQNPEPSYRVYHRGGATGAHNNDDWFDFHSAAAGTEGGKNHAVIGYGSAVFVLLWTGLVAACGLAVGARRRRRELGWLAANGADPNTLRLAVVSEGFVIGVISSVFGCVAGIGVAALAFPTLRDLTNAWTVTLSVPWLSVLVAPVVGVAAALIASAAAAYDVRRVTVADLLAGRGGRTRPAPAWFAAGLVLVAAGLGILVPLEHGSTRTAQVFAGLAVLALSLGLVAISVGAIRLLRRIPGPGVGARLVTRDLSRQGVRSAAAVAALALTAAGLGALLTHTAIANFDSTAGVPRTSLVVAGLVNDGDYYLVDGEVQRRLMTRSDLRPLESAFADAGLSSAWVPAVEVSVTAPEGSWAARGLIVDEIVDLFTPSQRDALRRGEILTNSYGAADLPDLMADAYLLRSVAQQKGLKVPAESESLVAYGALDDRSAAGLQRWTQGAVTYTNDPRLYDDGRVPPWVRLAMGGVASFITLVVLGLALALQRVESRPDEVVLVQVGAGPGLRRLMAGQRAGVLSAIAVIPGVVVGALVPVALTGRWEQVPYAELAASAVALPLVAFTVFWIFSHLPLPVGDKSPLAFR